VMGVAGRDHSVTTAPGLKFKFLPNDFGSTTLPRMKKFLSKNSSVSLYPAKGHPICIIINQVRCYSIRGVLMREFLRSRTIALRHSAAYRPMLNSKDGRIH
jgi:hypothetical protein